ncbi:pyridoxamine 5'-phosphate oxidase [Streptomyces sp. Amel2xB2]|uniref:pyridoxamine 5'-phosphate oxidase family protein n=1 Tax=Streptomyces sp. Amel2xB2 TaxID=1305829 RepID=UPI000DB94A00|nr:pyridoxamine 5'-phosphate oxidase family protein [Streptomyces sp. Amel2xB2]RAJ71638.1 pyridoxamine 5'-phosphate oxidase [Streptomyces sp. Amel2xB2]
MTSPPFDVDAFLSRPLTARVATNGPTVRPVWFLWEDGAFWIMTGQETRLCHRVRSDPHLALVVDECDVTTGCVRQVIAHGDGELVPFDVPRGRRKLARYLGPDESRWDPRLAEYVDGRPQGRGSVWVRLEPTMLRARDLSYAAAL